MRLAELLEMLAERSPIERIRLSSIDPEELTDELIAIVAVSGKFCPHFHLPLQAGDDAILARMRRRYTTAEYRDLVAKIRAAMPDAAIGTDVIAGFPGETDQAFAQGLNFIAGLPLAYMHVFPYSVRAGTTAAKFSDKVASAIIKQRAAALRELGEAKRERFAEAAAGQRLRVLVEREESGRLEGYSRNYLRVTADGPAALINHEVEVEALFVQGVAVSGPIIRTFS
jgi:threonylcarbamoyladenosine tRNA methylthiotransferase MtaB